MNKKICAALLAAVAACSPSPASEDSLALGVGASCESAAVFENALCTCSDLAFAGSLITEAASGEAANVGVNGAFSAASGSKIEGSLVTRGNISVSGNLTIRDDGASAAAVAGSGSLSVGKDLSVGGGLTTVGSLEVGGVLKVAGTNVHVGASKIGSVGPYETINAPCGCDPTSFIDIAGKVAAAEATNDNALAGLPNTEMAAVGATSFELGTGRFYLPKTAFVGSSKILVTGHAQLFVRGSITAVGDDQIQIAPGGSLDFYVDGSLASVGHISFGQGASPGAFRLYVGGKDAMLVHSGAQGWRGMIYAPTASVVFAGSATVEGSLFAHDVAYAGSLHVRYSKATTPTCAPDRK